MISEFGGFAEAQKEFFENVVWTRFWNTPVVLVLFLIIYNFAIAAIGTKGRKRFRQYFFGPVEYYSAD